MAAVANRIVVGYDGSEPARRALDRAADLAGYGTSVTVVSVASATNGSAPLNGGPPDVELTRRLLHEARDHLARRQVTAHTRDRIGGAAEEIVGAAEELGADLIVVGTRHVNALERLVLGSTSTKVLHQAPCDVLVVR